MLKKSMKGWKFESMKEWSIDDQVNKNGKWFGELDEKVFSFKHTLHSWFKNVELE